MIEKEEPFHSRTRTLNSNFDRMSRFFAIIVLLCCAAEICRAGDAPQAWVNAGNTNVMERILLHRTNNVTVLTYSNTPNSTTRIASSEIDSRNMDTVLNILRFFGTNHIVLGVCSLMAMLGFVFTLIIVFKTSTIAKVLQYNYVIDVYNKERVGFQKTFTGHMTSITEDRICSDKLLKTILSNVEAYRVKFNDILSYREKGELKALCKLLKKSATEANFNDVCNHLAILSGRLSKKGDKKNV